ncbi:hypothetical protein B0H14DRAFT_710654 [Mycena olivaceomarginata]|nr:hypothetical protein B0H14DRAFT_710654 [Mycena olivaceomarginata]
MQMREKIGKSLRRFSRVRPAPPAPGAAARPVVQAEVITGDPFLPPELEREIFELAAASDVGEGRTRQYVGKIMLTLPQVCRRAQSWIEPLIYERIQLLEWNGVDAVPQLLATINARPASFFRSTRQASLLPLDCPAARCPARAQRLHRCRERGVPSPLPHPRAAPRASPAPAPLPLQRLCVSEFVPHPHRRICLPGLRPSPSSGSHRASLPTPAPYSPLSPR